MDKSLEANAALREAQEFNDSYEAETSSLEQKYEKRDAAIPERTAQVMGKEANIGELEGQLKRERARFTKERRASEFQVGQKSSSEGRGGSARNGE